MDLTKFFYLRILRLFSNYEMFGQELGHGFLYVYIRIFMRLFLREIGKNIFFSGPQSSTIQENICFAINH